MAEIGNFTILPITIPSTPAYPKTFTHSIFLRPNAPKIPTASDARSLFLVNVPIDATAAHLRAVFGSLIGAGRFESVTFEGEKVAMSGTGVVGEQSIDVERKRNKKRKRGQEDGEWNGVELPRAWDRECRKSGGNAVVVFSEVRAVEAVLKAVRKLHKKGGGWPVWGEGVDAGELGSLGSQRYKVHQTLRFPDVEVLKKGVDAFMTMFNAKEEEKRRDDKRARTEVDEDGFVTVTRGGRVTPAKKENLERMRLEMEEKEKKRREELGGFYRFQMREVRCFLSFLDLVGIG